MNDARFNLLACTLCLCLLAPSASGAAWVSPDERGRGASGGLGEMVDRLKSLVDEAERKRWADRYFLRDLRTLIDDYDRPSRVESAAQRELMRDDFRDGDYTTSPSWRVLDGRFSVDARKGLRSIVATRSAPIPAAAGSEDPGADLAMALLGSLLEKKSTTSTSQHPLTSSGSRAVIHLPMNLPNAFVLRVEVVADDADGHLELGPYTGRPGDGGYRLSYRPGSASALELVDVSARGTTSIDRSSGSYRPPLGRGVLFEWVRSDDGEMSVTADGRELLATRDRQYMRDFDGVEIVNLGGDFSIREISLQTAPGRRIYR